MRRSVHFQVLEKNITGLGIGSAVVCKIGHFQPAASGRSRWPNDATTKPCTRGMSTPKLYRLNDTKFSGRRIINIEYFESRSSDSIVLDNHL